MLPKQTALRQHLLTLVLWGHPWLRSELSALLAPSDDASQQDPWFLLRGCPRARVRAEVAACSRVRQAPQGDRRAGVLGQEQRRGVEQ